MPLRAYIDNEEIISISLTDEQWEELNVKVKKQELLLTLPCCNQVGSLRKSSKGLKYFVLSKSDNTCDWKPESLEYFLQTENGKHLRVGELKRRYSKTV
ncbi:MULTISPECIES: hypothetical protein [Butyricimonas]|uniref:hypothetical protein n=1 Tax=Butyricimonas TaxID=574697 RepID=UPI001D083DE4|nr:MULTISPECIES: hypothetical protein [Butyricimonas]MCB6974315.1 hypothetical protein [Butyricimonas synergistica]MCG4521125.1 hypothetical protein [Butyricimonas sp. DFI.6.44]